MRGRQHALELRHDSYYLSMNEIITRILSGKIRLKESSQPHVGSIKNYILTNLEKKKKVHIRPLVGHLDQGNLWDEGDITIIDGSHLLKACVQLQQLALNKINQKDEQERGQALQVLGVFEQTVIPIQLHEGLTVEEQHQFYLDLNPLRKQTLGEKHIEEKKIRHEKNLGQMSGQTDLKG